MSTMRGFSLLELLIYMAILSLMSVVLATSFLSLTRGRAWAEAQSEVQANLRFALERISRDLGSAASVTTPASGTSGTLTFISSSTITYSVVNGVLERSVDGGVGERMTGSEVVISSPLFTRIDNYNAVLVATTTSIRSEFTVRYNTTDAARAYEARARSTTDLR